MQDTKIYIKLSEELTTDQTSSLQDMVDIEPLLSELQYLPNNWCSLKILDNMPRAVRDTNVTFSMARIGYDVMMLEGVDEIKYPIEKIKDKDLLKEEIEFENSNFDYDNFYSKKLSGTAIVITKDQMINVYSLIDHGSTVLNIYNYLYDRDPKESEWNYPIWQIEAVEEGNIIIQLCDDCSSPVWLPKGMNDYQYNTLMGLVDHLTEVDERGNYEIELGLEHSGIATPIKDAKDKINEMCRQDGLYDVPKAK